MNLDMLYSTFGDRILNLINNIPAPHPKVKIIIIHQNSNMKIKEKISNFLKKRNDITYCSINSIGVTKSRNVALKHISSDIVLFCDDDVIYQKNFQNNIINSYINNPNAGFITFAYSNIGSENPLPKFKKCQFKHNKFTILGLGTIQISCRAKYISQFNFKFPEDMGAGTKYFLCDEPVFISNFVKNNILGIYMPISICMHPIESSGDIFNNINAYISRLLCFTRIFGFYKGRLLYIIFTIKNIKKLKTLKNFNIAIGLIFTLSNK